MKGRTTNSVLDTPPIANEEKLLPRSTRKILTQVGSGWLNQLISYPNLLDPEVSNICPNYGKGPQSA